MSPNDLLEQLRARDIRLWLDGENLRVNAPAGRLTPELREQLAKHKSALRELLTRQASAGALAAEIETLRSAFDPERPFPASFAQRRLWFLDQLEPGNPAYNLGARFPLSGPVQRVDIEAAVDAVVQRHAVLRTVFVRADSDVVQVVRDFAVRDIPCSDVSVLTGAEHDRAADSVRESEARAPFDLATGPLYRVRLLQLSEDRHELLFTLHHIVGDGWSLGLIHQELNEILRARRSDTEPVLPELSVSYGLYSALERSRQPHARRSLDYWTDALAGAPATHSLPLDRPRPAVQTFAGAVWAFTLPAEVSVELRALAQHERTTLYVVLLTLFNVLVQRHGGVRDVVMGTPIANRPLAQLERLVGLFVSTTPVRVRSDAQATFRSLLAHVRESVMRAHEHQDLPFERLVEELQPERSTSWAPLFQLVFAFQNTPGASEFTVTTGASMYDLSLFMWDEADGIRGAFEYNTDLFETASIEALSRHFSQLARAVLAHPDTAVATLPMLEPAELQLVLHTWNDTTTPYPRGSSIVELFDRMAERRGPHTAVRTTKSTSAARALSYAELQQRSIVIATALANGGVTAGMRVGLHMRRSLDTIAAMLGVLRAGACFVPLGAAQPKRRLEELATLAGISLVIRDADMPELAVPRARSVSLATLTAGVASARMADLPAPRAIDPAYVMFTSGTTGTPKGVVVAHQNVVRLVTGTRYADFGPDERLLQLAPIEFDASTFEIWGALLNGGELVVYPENAPGARALAETLRDDAISTLWLTAGLFHSMIENELEALAGVRQVLAGGDVLSVAHVQRLLDAKSEGVVINGYGPTENTTFTCVHRMEPGLKLANTVPIGRPIANTRVYVLDDTGQPTPVGVTGELYAAGDGVALGYLSGEEPGEARFLSDPFSAEPGARLYRTGDSVLWRHDGTLEFLGRRDRQVKVRGFRVELAEVEQQMLSFPVVGECAVTIRKSADGSNELVGYVVPRFGQTVDLAALHQHLAHLLPEFMVPRTVMVLAQLPLTANGKVDRAALPEPSSAPKEVVEPRTALEAQLLSIWEDVLERSGFGIRANFFDLGGHSLLAIKLFAKIERVLLHRLPISVLFQAPTVEKLARALGRSGFRSPWSSLVALQPEGAKPSLFLVPGLGGNVLGYAELARQLGKEQPLYALQSRGLDGRETPFASVEEMAAHFVAEVRSAQPKGPYYLGGACFGGAVAYEMAQQLRGVGEEIAFLLLLETWQPPSYSRLRDPLMRTMQRMRYLSGAVRGRAARFVDSSTRGTFRQLPARLRAVGDAAAATEWSRVTVAANYLDRVSIANYKAFARYRPKPYSGEVVLVIASARPFEAEIDPRMLWARLAAGGSRRIEIPAADSGLLLKSPYVERLAVTLFEELGRAAPQS